MKKNLQSTKALFGLICLIFVIIFPQDSFAQATGSFNQTGIIRDQGDLKIHGVNVVNKKTGQAVSSNVDGGYSIKANNGDTIQFSMMGYETQKIVADATRKNYNVKLAESNVSLKEVVVTALGIKRDERELGYAFSEVKGSDINKAKETNVINSLAGKVPGLIINSTAGGPAGSSRVIIRGNTSITGNNQPLYVIDGIPMDNSNYGQVGSTTYAGGVDMGDAISAINPDDVDKISVLKGPSAAALYGSSAANGVILITTKKGNNSKELGIELNSTSTIETQLTKLDNVQYLYGQGRSQLLPRDREDAIGTLFTNFGPRLDPNLNYIGFDGVTRPYALVKDNIQNFFQTGSSFNNTIALTSATDKSNFRFSVGDLRYQDIIPKSNIRRNTYTFSGRSKFGDKLSLEVRASYLNEDVNNREALGDSPSNIGFSFNGLANNVDQAVFSNNYKTAQGDYLEWGGGQYHLNPYWVINEMYNKTLKNRLTGSFNLNYVFNKSFSVLIRASTDLTFLNYESYSPRTTPGAVSGTLDGVDQQYATTQADILATYTKQLGQDFNLSLRAGASINSKVQKGTTSQFSNMVITDVVSPNSFADKTVIENDIRRRVNSGYGLATIGYKRFLYLDATIRQDASSTLPQNNNIYTYPSLSSSFVFTDAFKIDPSILSFGKIRASAAEVGNDTDPYLLNVYYGLYPLNFNGNSFGGISSKILPPQNLKPTRTRSFEVGTNLKFFNGRINFDATYYTSRSRDQINIIPGAISSGYSKQIVNAGVIANKGVELLLSGSIMPDRSKFQWDLSVNFARNISKVESLADGIPFLSLSDARWLGLSVIAKPGEQYGAILGYDFQKDSHGNIILDNVTLTPKSSAERQILGKGVFDWTGGITSHFSYGNLSLNAVFDVKYGADLFSMTNLFSMIGGSSLNTVAGRDEWILSEENRLAAKKTAAEWQAAGLTRGFVPQGVVQTGTDANGNPIYTPNTRAVDPSVYWGAYYTDGNGIARPFIYKATYVKVREITISFRLPKTLNTKIGWKDASVGLVARNPFIIYKNVPNVDPDSNYNNGNGQGLEYGSLPSRRGWGLNLNVKF